MPPRVAHKKTADEKKAEKEEQMRKLKEYQDSLIESAKEQRAKRDAETSYARSDRNLLVVKTVDDFNKELLKSELLLRSSAFPRVFVSGMETYSLKGVSDIFLNLLKSLKEDIAHITQIINKLNEIDDQHPAIDPKDPDLQ